VPIEEEEGMNNSIGRRGSTAQTPPGVFYPSAKHLQDCSHECSSSKENVFEIVLKRGIHSQTERFYCVTSYLTEELSKLRSFDRQ
jgi:hypothetical protein